MRFLRPFKGLFCENDGNGISIGRILLWIVIGFMCRFWSMDIVNSKKEARS